MKTGLCMTGSDYIQKMVKSTNNSDINQCESNINALEANIMDVDVDTATDELEEENQDYFSTDSLSDDDSDDDSEITQGLNSEEKLKLPIYTGEGLKFMPDHPLYDTHRIFCLDKSEGFVPNFIGGPLPRSDCGDREYYCSTMLTLFKPWHDGRDLRTDEQSWDDSFVNHKFSSRQTELMKYFNLKYECLDARDDYAAQLKQGEGVGIFSVSDGDYEDNIEGVHHSQGYGDSEFECEDDKIRIGRDIGKATNSTINLRNEMHDIMRASGWFDKSPDGPPEHGDLTPIQPEINLTEKEWSNEVKAK